MVKKSKWHSKVVKIEAWTYVIPFSVLHSTSPLGGASKSNGVTKNKNKL